ncbi:MAG: hypothetical protein EOO43_13420, partial [Flavobacterium sp.]
ARFDEENNLEWKKTLEEEGVKVLIGIPDIQSWASLCGSFTKKDAKKRRALSSCNLSSGAAQMKFSFSIISVNPEIKEFALFDTLAARRSNAYIFPSSAFKILCVTFKISSFSPSSRSINWARVRVVYSLSFIFKYREDIWIDNENIQSITMGIEIEMNG